MELFKPYSNRNGNASDVKYLDTIILLQPFSFLHSGVYYYYNGSLGFITSGSNYWSKRYYSTIYSYVLGFTSTSLGPQFGDDRAYGISLRCLARYICYNILMQIGKVIIPSNTRPWPHEKRLANILATAGYRVEFIPESNTKTADIYLNKTPYEIKSPISDRPKAIERNLARAIKQCPNIIFDSSRMKIRDPQILHELIKCYNREKGIKRLLFINKHKEIIDISSII